MAVKGGRRYGNCIVTVHMLMDLSDRCATILAKQVERLSLVWGRNCSDEAVGFFAGSTTSRMQQGP